MTQALLPSTSAYPNLGFSSVMPHLPLCAGSLRQGVSSPSGQHCPLPFPHSSQLSHPPAGSWVVKFLLGKGDSQGQSGVSKGGDLSSEVHAEVIGWGKQDQVINTHWNVPCSKHSLNTFCMPGTVLREVLCCSKQSPRDGG